MSKQQVGIWLGTLGGLVVTALIGASFLLQYHLNTEERERAITEIQLQRQAVEEQFRSTLVRVYQNLRLNHFLAAHRNLEGLEELEISDPVLRREYFEAVSRVAEGLLENNYHDESELLFLRLQDQEQYEARAREAIGFVASSRRRDSARNFLSAGRELVQQKRFRDAAAELRRARLEFESVELFKVHDVSEEMKELASLLRDANYHVALAEAKTFIETAESLLETGVYLEAQTQLRRASVQLARARFHWLDSPEIEILRSKMLDIESEIAVRFPNSLPIENRYEVSRTSELEDFFVLENYNFKKLEDRLQLELSYQMNLATYSSFIVRYQIFFFSGQHFSNGHFFTSEKNTKPGESQLVVIDQELPAHLLAQDIKTVDVRVYNPVHELVSRVTRAYRRPG
jgi:hypothetical protein